MSDINKVILVGRIVRDIELKFIPSGTAVASLGIANNKTWTQNGEKKEQTSFFNCIAWSKIGEIMAEHCKKGQRIGIEGRLQQRSWEDKDGNKRSTVEVVVDNFQFLDSKGQADGQANKPAPDSKADNAPAFDDIPEGNPFDEDLPF